MDWSPVPQECDAPLAKGNLFPVIQIDVSPQRVRTMVVEVGPGRDNMEVAELIDAYLQQEVEIQTLREKLDSPRKQILHLEDVGPTTVSELIKYWREQRRTILQQRDDLERMGARIADARNALVAA